MKYVLYALFLLTTPLFGESAIEDVKGAIAECKEALNASRKEQEKSEIYYRLSKYYLLDQELDQAFVYFLKALQGVKAKRYTFTQEEEKEAFNHALELYLSKAGTDPIHVANELLDTYEAVAMKSSDFLALQFVLSTAHANLGHYEQFFTQFYESYPYFKDDFLSYKTQGILHLRLSQHSREDQERIQNKKEAAQLLKCALEKNPQDASLYKVLIFLAKDGKEAALVRRYLKEVVQHKVPLARGDICFYVREAVSLKEYTVAEKLIEHAQGLYEYSRSITSAQEYLNQNRG